MAFSTSFSLQVYKITIYWNNTMEWLSSGKSAIVKF